MSVKRARQVLRGGAGDIPPLLDMPEHRGFIRYLTGLDCMKEPEEAISRAVRLLDVGILMCSAPHAAADPEQMEQDPNLYNLSPTAWRNHDTTDSRIFEHDPLANRGGWNVNDDALFRVLAGEDLRNREIAGGTAITHGFLFTTCFHYAAEDLDYEAFLCACVEEPEKIDTLLDRYEALSTRLLHAWRRVNVEMMLCHDDIANAQNLTLSPAFYRRHLFPRYKRLYAPFKENGIPVFSMTDGNFLSVAQDYVEAGADGFFLDRPAIELDDLAAVCGRGRFYFTGPAPEIMTNGTPKDVAYEMDRLREMSRDIPGFIFHMPGGWVHNMPVENVKAYYACQGRL